ncbi:hypothetical protein HaLaN_00533 [Haematococcus lacustris]|uniref:Uncharacterized protein n=1 Tax=Haematococcus lacustris TaxID=44745 RepID=A0A699YJ80_HAELA|nr:hypothetical protein HaLaN_00533 [Haematococcus lacustris]
MEMMEERLSAANAAEEDMLADMRAIKLVKQQLAKMQEEIYFLEERLSAANAAVQDSLAELRTVKAQAADLQQDLTREREEMEMMEERLSTANAAEEDMLADMRAIKEQLASAQSQLALTTTTTSSSAGHDDGTVRGQAQPQPPAVRGSGGSSFPMGFGCVEQRECLDQLSVAVEQLADAMVWEDNLHCDVTRHLVTALRIQTPGADLLTSNWCRHTCSTVLHSYIMEEAVACVQYQQQTIWFQSDCDLCLAVCPESGRTDLQAAMQQLQQAKSSTLFLVAQQQAPSHPATREAAEYVEGIRRHMQQRLEQQLGLDKDIEAGEAWQPELLAVATAATRTQLLVTGLQGSCPGLQLVSSLEDWAAPEGQRAHWWTVTSPSRPPCQGCPSQLCDRSKGLAAACHRPASTDTRTAASSAADGANRMICILLSQRSSGAAA